MRAILTAVLLAFTLIGCAADPVSVMKPPSWPVGARWCADERPAHVIVSDALEPGCWGAMAAAVTWWLEKGVDYLTFEVVPDAELKWGTPMPLFIQVTTDYPEDPASAADTRISQVTPGCIQAAEIRFDPFWCRDSATTARHELGHALGLPDLYGDKDRDNLMFWVGATTDHLTEEQLRQIR